MSARDRITLVGPYQAAPHWRSPIARNEKEAVALGKYSLWLYEQFCEQITRTSPQWEPLALIYEGGTLVRNRHTGLMAAHYGNQIKSINPRKAAAALQGLAPDQAHLERREI